MTHAEDYSYNDIRYGGSNQLGSGWTIDLHFVQIGDHVVDTEVDVVSTTDVHGVTTETGRRHTFRDNLIDHSSYALEVEDNFGGGSGLSGNFTVSADGGSTSKSTEDITIIDGTITDRAITELLTTGNGYHFQMSADGNGFEIVTSAGGGNSLEQNKRENLDYEVIDGTRMNDSGYYNRVKIDGFGDTTSSGGSGDETLYRITRYFGQNGVTTDYDLNQYNRTHNSKHTSTNGQNGETKDIQVNTVTNIATDINTVGTQGVELGKILVEEHTGYESTTDSQSNVSYFNDLGTTLDYTLDLFGGVDEFASFVPELPFFDPLTIASHMMDYVNGGNWHLGAFLFPNNGTTQAAPNPTGPPVASGTEPDGTYWEFYNNGNLWIKRTYSGVGGEPIREDWGYHTQTFHDLLKGFNQLIEDANKSTVIESIDEFFADLTEVGKSLSETNNVPNVVKEESLEDIKNRIRNLRRFRQTVGLPLVYRKAITEEIKELVKDYLATGGDIHDLSINGTPSVQDVKTLEKFKKDLSEAVKNYDPRKIPISLIDELIEEGVAFKSESGNAVIIPIDDKMIVLKYHLVVKYTDLGTGLQSTRDDHYSIFKTIPRYVDEDGTERSIENAAEFVDLENDEKFLSYRASELEALHLFLQLFPGGASTTELLEDGIANGLKNEEFYISAVADLLFVLSTLKKFQQVNTLSKALQGTNFGYDGVVSLYRGYQLYDEGDYGAGAEILLRLYGMKISKDQLKRIRQIAVAKREADELAGLVRKSKQKYEPLPNLKERADNVNKIRIYTSEQVEDFRVISIDGKMIWAKTGKPVTAKDGSIFIMDEAGNFYVYNGPRGNNFRGDTHHSSLANAFGFSGGGGIIVKNGKIISFDNSSGHYKPSVETNDIVYQELVEQGFNTKGIKIDDIYR